jgi:hypothetical protein
VIMENSLDGRCTESTRSHRRIQSVATVIINQTSTHRGIFYTADYVLQHAAEEERLCCATAWRSRKMCCMSFWLGPTARMFSGKQVIRRALKKALVERMQNAEVILTQRAAEPGVSSGSAGKAALDLCLSHFLDANGQ